MTLQLWNASVIDSRSPRAVNHMCITLRDGTIEQVAAMQGAVPDGAVDLGGRFVIPGLIDAHIHLADDPKMLRDAALPKARQGEEPRPDRGSEDPLLRPHPLGDCAAQPPVRHHV